MNTDELSRRLHESAAAAPVRTIDSGRVMVQATRIRRRRHIVAAACAVVLAAGGLATGLLVTAGDGPQHVTTITPAPLPSTTPGIPGPTPSPPPPSPTAPPTTAPAVQLPPGWTAATAPPVSAYLAQAAVGSKIVYWGAEVGQDAVGGYGNKGVVFDVARRAWSQTPPSPVQGRYGAAAAGSDQLFFVWGGDQEFPAGRPLADGASYDVAAHAWRMLPAAPLKAGRPLGGVWNGHAFVVVSQDGCAAYDPATNRWQRLPSIPTPPTEASVVQVGDRTYVIGAYSYYLARGASAWTPIPSLQNALVSTMTAATDGKTLFGAAVTGSRPGPVQAPLIVDRFDESTATWVALPASPAKEVNCYPPLAVTPRNVFVACGSSALFDRVTGTWTEYDRPITISDAAVAVGSSIVFAGSPTLIYSP